jgi:tRNA(Ile)-lysidine synthase TilS/MesJ
MQKTDQERKVTRQFEKICNKVGKAINEFQLIGDGDGVLVGLSGGKDSMILLEALANRKQHLPYSFELFAIHVSATNVGYSIDTSYLSDFCASLNVPLFLEEIEVNLDIDPEKSPCFICSWHRRKTIFNKSKELGCNKVALGHHKDDAIQTMLMNLIYHGSISSLPQKLEMFGGRIHLIRPLLMIPENELSYYAGMRSYKKLEKNCRYSQATKREAIKDLVREIDKLNKNARKNLFRAMDNIYPDYLPRSKGEG